MVSRRQLLAAGGTAFACSVAGCNSLAGGGSTTPTPSYEREVDEPAYERWFGPAILDFQHLSNENTGTYTGFGKVFAFDLNAIASNPHILQEHSDELRPFSAVPDVVTDSQRDRDIELRIESFNNTFDVNVGSFDVEDLRAEMPDDAEQIGTLGEHVVHSWTSKLRHEGVTREGVAATAESIVWSLGYDDNHLLENLGTVLSLGTGERDRFIDTDGATKRFFDRLGDGHWTSLIQFGETPQFGIRMRFEEDIVHRKTVAMYDSETAARESEWADPETIEPYRTTPGDGRPSETHDKFVNYRNFDHTVDGRFVVFSGTLDTRAITRDETMFP